MDNNNKKKKKNPWNIDPDKAKQFVSGFTGQKSSEPKKEDKDKKKSRWKKLLNL